MVQVTIKTDLSQTIRLLEHRYRRQLPFATSKALNETAKIVQREVVSELQKRFDRPTPYVLKSIFIKYSKKNSLRAEVFLRERMAGNNSSSLAEILEHQFKGGPRIRTRLEKALSRAGLIANNEYVAPGAGAKLDRYGNISRGQLKQLLSQILSSTNQSTKQGVKRSGYMFWSRGDNLPRGAYILQGKSVKPLLMVVNQPRYKKRIDMDVIATRVVQRDFDAIFSREFEVAARTAR